jgi:NAD(P)-dependent dehydrogenase (short-subunit alcohol dehydrogenase family)
MELATAKAIISGGASGLGYATAARVVAAGGRAALLDLNEEQGRKAAEALGAGATFHACDVSNEDAVRAAVAAAAAAMDGLSLAVSCAGIATAGRALGRDGPWPAEKFLRVLQVNLLGTFNLAKETAAVMQHNEPDANGDRGVIVGTASIAAYEGQIGQAAYSASKGGVVAMTLPLAREFAQFGIRVNAIAPGIFHTPMMAGMPDEIQASLAQQVPYPQRLGRPEEYAATVAFIYETAYLNAETIRVDGAIRMQPR